MPNDVSGKVFVASNSPDSAFGVRLSLDGFIADFASFDARLVVEVEGATHSTDEEIAYDAARSAAIAAQGFAVLRFANEDVYRKLEGVLETIRMRLMELRPRNEDVAV
jgi:very-short-patch-repair endonuclease